jgi:hypothetical protein
MSAPGVPVHSKGDVLSRVCCESSWYNRGSEQLPTPHAPPRALRCPSPVPTCGRHAEVAGVGSRGGEARVPRSSIHCD